MMSNRLIGKEAPENPSGFLLLDLLQASGSRAHSHHEAIVAQFSDLHPCKRIVAIGRQAAVHLAEMRIALRKVRIDIARGVIAGFQHFLRERAQDRAGHEQPPQRWRIDVVILFGDPRKRIM
jgi:hypothetical protein